jgi:branched-chain amino acid transport system ATP-binding protein
MLQVQDLEVSYGPLQVLWGVSLTVQQGEIVALIGANGAGKTTFLKTCMGQLPARSGRVHLDSRDVTRTPTYKIVRLGMTLVPEGRHVFPDLTVTENLTVATYAGCGVTVAQAQAIAFEIFPRMHERRLQKAGTLSGGEQQMLAVARALVGRPRLLLLDEPSLGLAPLLVDELFQQFQKINAQGTSILLVEQNAFLALEISHRAYVLQSGRITLEGQSTDLLKQDAVRESYLGGVVETPE